MSSTPKLSIVIPNKNNPDLLLRCLDSIPQNDDVQIIVVDDNSDSDKIDFSNYPGKDRSDVKIILNKDGLGAGHARNIGLEHVEGDYLIFMDSDDFLLENGLANVMELLYSKYDIIFTLPESVFSDNLQPSDRKSYHKKHAVFLKGKNLERWLRYGFYEPWGKIFRTKFIKEQNITFQESRVGNDALFSVKSGYAANKVKFEKICYYCVTERKGSLSNNIYGNWDKIEARLDINMNLQKFFEEKGINMYPLYSMLRVVRRGSTVNYKRAVTYLVDKGYTLDEIKRGILKSYISRIKVCFGIYGK